MLILNLRYVLGLSHYNGLGKEDSLKVLWKAGLNWNGACDVRSYEGNRSPLFTDQEPLVSASFSHFKSPLGWIRAKRLECGVYDALTFQYEASKGSLNRK